MQKYKILTITDKDGNAVEITEESYLLHGIALGVFTEEGRVDINRRALWTHLGMTNELCVSLDLLAVEKSEANIALYKDARKKIETAFLYHRYNNGQLDPYFHERIVRNDVATCKFCGQRIVWLNKDGRMVPVNASSVWDETKNFQDFHVLHFATCTNTNTNKKNAK